jgi:cyclic pyranopterin phosphate synthase
VLSLLEMNVFSRQAVAHRPVIYRLSRQGTMMSSAPEDRNLSHIDPEGRPRMVDVGEKAPTRRRAVAAARVCASAELIEKIAANALAKGNLLDVARLAGIQAAKRTAELIPLCHSLPIEHADVQAWIEGEHIELRAEASTFSKTGVEMEALTAVSVAALTVIDMGKAVDRSMVIESVRLLEKSGGRSGEYRAPEPIGATDDHARAAAQPAQLAGRGEITAAVLTVSDRCSRGEAEDRSGPALVRLLSERLGARVAATDCVPDDEQTIRSRLVAWATENPRPDLILTTGGTGLGPHDVTPEATGAVLDRRHPGLLELVRQRCAAKTPRVFLSRGEAGTIAQTLLINLPGSERGATESLEALLDVLPHAVEMLHGKGH